MQKLFFSFIVLQLFSFRANDKVKTNDFEMLKGNWTGTLTYLNYSSSKKSSIPCDLEVIQSPADKRVWYFKKQYPKEPHANTIDTIRISNDGSMINSRKLIKKFKNKHGELELIFAEKYNDDGVIKDFQFTYSLSKKSFSIRKQESSKGEPFIERNRYEWQRE